METFRQRHSIELSPRSSRQALAQHPDVAMPDGHWQASAPNQKSFTLHGDLTRTDEEIRHALRHSKMSLVILTRGFEMSLPQALRPILAAAVILGSSFTAETSFAANRFSVVSIVNETNANVGISYKWGPNDAVKSMRLQPRERRWFSWAYPRENYDRSPDFLLQYDADTGGKYYRSGWKRLRGYASPDQNFAGGNEYVFKYDGQTHRFIEIQDRVGR